MVTERSLSLAVHWYCFSLMNERISTQNWHPVHTLFPNSTEAMLSCIGEIPIYFNDKQTEKDYEKEKREFYLPLPVGF